MEEEVKKVEAAPSLDKIISKMSFALQQPNYVVPLTTEVKNRNGGYMSWGGEKNNYPQNLLRMFDQSSLHKAIVLRKVDEIVANGIYSNDKTVQTFLDKCNARGQNFDEVFRKIVLDYVLFNGFSLQMVPTKATNKLSGVFWMDIAKARFNLIGETVKYSENWEAQKVTQKEYPIYTGQAKDVSVFYYAGPNTRGWYPNVEYNGSVPAIESTIEIDNFWLNQIRNGMFPMMMVDIKGGIPTEDQQRKIERDFIAKFGGSSNAGKVMFNFSENTDGGNTEVKTIEATDLGNKFINLYNTVRDSIFIGHRVTNSALFGVQQAGKLGGQSAEYAEGYEIFQKTYVIPTQRIILRTLNKLLAVEFPGIDLKIKPLAPIGIRITDQAIMVQFMTEREVRENLVESMIIPTADIAEGEILIKNEPNPINVIGASDTSLTGNEITEAGSEPKPIVDVNE